MAMLPSLYFSGTNVIPPAPLKCTTSLPLDCSNAFLAMQGNQDLLRQYDSSSADALHKNSNVRLLASR